MRRKRVDSAKSSGSVPQLVLRYMQGLEGDGGGGVRGDFSFSCLPLYARSRPANFNYVRVCSVVIKSIACLDRDLRVTSVQVT